MIGRTAAPVFPVVAGQVHMQLITSWNCLWTMEQTRDGIVHQQCEQLYVGLNRRVQYCYVTCRFGQKLGFMQEVGSQCEGQFREQGYHIL
jgi:hypothetical protein